MKIIRSKDAKTTLWSGGTTTELAISPEGAVYADRDFDWRLSSAEVNDEKSTFTALPDYYRYITVRKGSLRMRHDGGVWYEIGEGDIAGFDGGSLTESEGKVTDFNLMLRKGRVDGDLSADILEDGESVDLEPAKAGCVTALFLSRGKALRIEDGGRQIAELAEGDLLIFEEDDTAAGLTGLADGAACIIRADIRRKK